MTDVNQSRTAAPRQAKRLGVVVFVLVFALIAGGALVLREAIKSTPASANGALPGAPTPAAGSAVRMLEDARAAMSEQKYPEAEAILTKAAEAYPEDQGVRVQLAQVLVAQKKFKEAYAQYEAAIALAPRRTDTGAPSVGDPALHFEAGTVADDAGLIDRAEEHYSMAQSGNPAEPRYPLYLAMVQIKLGKDSAALASLVRATRLNPDLAIAWGTLAELALKQNQLGLGMQHIEKARRLEPEAARWRVVEAKLLKRRAEKGDVEKALQLLLSLDKADRMRPEVMSTLGECYGLLQRPADAAFMYAEAFKLKPDDAELAFTASQWYERAGNEAEAARLARLAQAAKERRK